MDTPGLDRFAALALALAVGCSSQQTQTEAPGPVSEVVAEVVAAPVAAPTLEQHVRFLTGHEPTRDWSHPAALDAVAEYLREQLAAAGGRVEFQEYEVRDETYRNVRAHFGPEPSEAAGAALVVGAHYDVAGELPGADDNASGVAVLLGLARRLGAIELTVPVELVAYSLEEPPFFRTEDMGSAVHAEALAEADRELRGMICLEMVGYYTDEPDSQEYPAEALAAIYPSVGNYLAVVGRETDAELVTTVHDAMDGATELPVMKLLAPAFLPGVDYSDHLNYWEEDFTALMLTDTAFYRNPNYHTAQDTPETLDYRRMGFVVEGLLAAVLELTSPPPAQDGD